MKPEEFSADAHAVYAFTSTGRVWVATFRTKGLAEGYVQWHADAFEAFGLTPPVLEVVPV